MARSVPQTLLRQSVQALCRPQWSEDRFGWRAVAARRLAHAERRFRRSVAGGALHQRAGCARLSAMTRPALDDLIALALAAGREIMAVRAAGVSTTEKLDGSIVTLADHRAEAVIEEGLAKLTPGVAMIGEEAVAQGRIPECGDT